MVLTQVLFYFKGYENKREDIKQRHGLRVHSGVIVVLMYQALLLIIMPSQGIYPQNGYDEGRKRMLA